MVQLKSRQRMAIVSVSVAGILASGTLVAAFVLSIVQNTLPLPTGDFVRGHYLAIGDSFSDGFMAGFFLCFFMMLCALVIGSWVEERRAARERRQSPR